MGIGADAAYYGLGYAGATPVAGGTAVQFALLKGVSVNHGVSLEALRAQYKYPLAMGIGDCSIKGKIDSMTILGGSLAVAMGGVSTVGQEMVITGESHTIPGSSTYTVTATQTATFSRDLAVYNVTEGKLMIMTTSTLAKDKYSVDSAGLYTFHEDNKSQVVQLNYSYTAAATGLTTTITNSIMKIAPLFRVACVTADTEAAGGILYVIYPTVAFGNMSWDTKDKSWTTTNVEFEACADVGQSIMVTSTQL